MTPIDLSYRRITQLLALAVIMFLFMESKFIDRISTSERSRNITQCSNKRITQTESDFSHSRIRSDLTRRLEDYLKENESNGFSGAVLVAVHNDVILEKGYGLADRETRVPMTTSSVFDIGSITKQFTATAILKLVEQNKLKVTSRLTDFFEQVPEDKRYITIHQLLTHTSGISSYTGDDYEYVTDNEFLTTVLSRELEAKPGEQYIYSNVGYSLLGIIVERASGLPYEQFLQRFLFQTAGMGTTGYLQPQLGKF